jgi:hypothetical protein
VLGRACLQVGVQFAASACNGVLVEAGNQRHEADASMTNALGFYSRIPTPLLLVEAAEEHVHLLVQKPLRVVGFLLTGSTFATVDLSGRHGLLFRKDEPTVPEIPKSFFDED